MTSAREARIVQVAFLTACHHTARPHQSVEGGGVHDYTSTIQRLVAQSEAVQERSQRVQAYAAAASKRLREALHEASRTALEPSLCVRVTRWPEGPLSWRQRRIS